MSKLASPHAEAWLNTNMVKVYGHMALGLFITFLVSWGLAQSPVLMGAIFNTWLKWPVLLAPLVFVFFMSFGYDRSSARTLQILFFVFSVLQGLGLSTIFMIYASTSIVGTLFICSLLFAAMSIYGYFTKRSLDKIGDFLIMALIGVIIAMIVNMFLQSAMMTTIISVIGVFLFLGLTAFDTQRIKLVLWQEPETNKAVVLGALTLYLDFINLFLFLLNLIGIKTGKD